MDVDFDFIFFALGLLDRSPGEDGDAGNVGGFDATGQDGGARCSGAAGEDDMSHLVSRIVDSSG